VDAKSPPTPAELTILIAGAVMLVGSFFSFAGSTNAWGTFLFPLATLLPLYGVLMAAQIAVTKFAELRLPERIAGFSWEQAHLVIGLLAGLMALGWLFTDIANKGIGYWLEVLGGIVIASGAIALQHERNAGPIR
jgi:hypothetical protein